MGLEISRYGEKGDDNEAVLKNGVKVFLPDLIKILKSVLSDLESISAASERQFSMISGNLQKYYLSSKEVSEKAFDIIKLLTGEEYNYNTEKIKKIFENISGSIVHSQNEFERSDTFFKEIVESIVVITEDVSGFKRLVKYLHNQGIATKIESSRLGGDDKGFKNLAENVDELSIVISDKFNKFRVETESLIKLIKIIQTEEINLKRKQQSQSIEILNNSKESLNLLVDKHDQSASKYEIIFSNFQEIQKNIGEMVTSVQFHDITRQQLQHVFNTLKDLIKKISDEINSGIPKPEYLLNTVYDISKIQCEQLKHSREELCTATEAIIANLKSILENIYYMTREIIALLNSNGNNNSFIVDIQQGLNNVSNSLINNNNLGLNFFRSISKVTNTINSLAGFINEIGEVGSEIELVSLNANIKAVHIGKDGATLAVIAGEIQKLSIDARKQTDICNSKNS